MKAVANISNDLPNEPCVHGMSNKNWCALCMQASGDKHSNTVIKAFTTKSPKKRPYDSKKTVIETKDNKSKKS